jgi:hypothetical protein
VVANRTDERRIEAIAALRRVRFTGAEIAELLGMAVSTVSGILTRIGMGKLGRLGLEPTQRYERARPGRRSAVAAVDASRRRCESGSTARVTRISPTPVSCYDLATAQRRASCDAMAGCSADAAKCSDCG